MMNSSMLKRNSYNRGVVEMAQVRKFLQRLLSVRLIETGLIYINRSLTTIVASKECRDMSDISNINGNPACFLSA